MQQIEPNKCVSNCVEVEKKTKAFFTTEPMWHHYCVWVEHSLIEPHLYIAASMLKLLFCLRTFTEFHSHFHAFILTKQTIINTDCVEGMHFSALVHSFCHSVCSIFVFENVYLRNRTL